MASITVKIATVPTRSDSDTVASYNIYSNQPSANTLIGTMTPAEASAGKAMTFSDGVVHTVTAKAVWTTAGESTIGSTNVNIDTTGSSSIIIFSDAFTGTTVDTTTNWDLAEENNSALSITQNAKLEFNHSTTTTTTWGTYVRGKTAYTLGSALFGLYFKVYTPNLNDPLIIGLSKDTYLSDATNQIFIQINSSNTGVVVAQVKIGGTAHYTTYSVDCSTGEQEFKIQEESGEIAFYHYTGSAWVEIYRYTSYSAGDYKPFIAGFNKSSSIAAVSTVDDFILTDSIFTDHVPS